MQDLGVRKIHRFKVRQMLHDLTKGSSSPVDDNGTRSITGDDNLMDQPGTGGGGSGGSGARSRSHSRRDNVGMVNLDDIASELLFRWVCSIVSAPVDVAGNGDGSAQSSVATTASAAESSFSNGTGQHQFEQAAHVVRRLAAAFCGGAERRGDVSGRGGGCINHGASDNDNNNDDRPFVEQLVRQCLTHGAGLRQSSADKEVRWLQAERSKLCELSLIHI